MIICGSSDVISLARAAKISGRQWTDNKQAIQHLEKISCTDDVGNGAQNCIGCDFLYVSCVNVKERSWLLKSWITSFHIAAISIHSGKDSFKAYAKHITIERSNKKKCEVSTQQ
jgi:hypothetical protein